MKQWKPQKKIARTATAIGKITFMNNNILTPNRVSLLNGDDRARVIRRSIAHLKKELQIIDDENDLTYDELNEIVKGFGFWTHSK